MSKGSRNEAAEDAPAAVIVEGDRRSEIGAFVLGAIVGAGLALLLAPSSGEETQRRLRRQARRLKALTHERMKGLQGEVSAGVASATGAIRRGGRLVAEARRELEDKLARSKAEYRAVDGPTGLDESPGLEAPDVTDGTSPSGDNSSDRDRADR